MHAPPIRFPVLNRQRVLDMITGNLESGVQLLLIEAPQGYGKTTALSQWMNSPSSYSKRIWVSANDVVEGSGLTVEGGRDWARTHSDPFVVILDDYEDLTGFSTDESLIELLAKNPKLKFVVSTRHSTLLSGPLATSKVRVESIGAQDLRFTLDEYAELVRAQGIESLVRGMDLWTRVEGWPLGVQAALHSARHSVAPEDCAALLADGLLRVANDGLANQLLTGLALFEGIPNSTFSHVLKLPEDSVSRSLTDLEKLGAFRSDSPDRQPRCRVIPAIGPYLRGQAPNYWTTRELSELTGEMAEQVAKEDPAWAVRMLLEDGNLEAASRITVDNFMAVIDAGQKVLPALRRLPLKAFEDYSDLLMARVILERTDPAHPLANIEAMALTLSRASRRALATASFRRSISIQAHLIASERMVGNWDEALRLSRDLMRRLDDLQRGGQMEVGRSLPALYSVVSLTGCLTGELDLALHASAAGLEVSLRTEDHLETVHAHGLLALANVLKGEMAAAKEHLAEMDTVAEEERPKSHEFSWADGEIARVLLATNAGDLEAAGAALSSLVALAERMEQWPMVAYAEADYTALAHSQVESLALLENRLSYQPSPRGMSNYWRARILEWRANTSIFAGRIVRAESLIEESGLLEPFALSTRVRISLVKRQYADVVSRVSAALEQDQRPLPRKLLTLHGAVAAGRRGDPQQAKKWWRELAEGHLPSWFFSMVPYEWLVESVVKGQVPEALAGMINELPRKHQMPYFEPLTSAESVVLRALSEGKSIPATAMDLFLSENTVKFHLRSIYRKLRVSDRDEAVRVGRRMGAISDGQYLEK